MSSAMNKWGIPEGLEPFGSMADFAFQLRGFFDTDESAGFAVAGGVTDIPLFKVFFVYSPLKTFNIVTRCVFFCIADEA